MEAVERVRGRAGARSQGLRERKVRRPVRVRPVAELGFVVIAVGFVVVVLLVLHWAAPATN